MRLAQLRLPCIPFSGLGVAAAVLIGSIAVAAEPVVSAAQIVGDLAVARTVGTATPATAAAIDAAVEHITPAPAIRPPATSASADALAARQHELGKAAPAAVPSPLSAVPIPSVVQPTVSRSQAPRTGVDARTIAPLSPANALTPIRSSTGMESSN